MERSKCKYAELNVVGLETKQTEKKKKVPKMR